MLSAPVGWPVFAKVPILVSLMLAEYLAIVPPNRAPKREDRSKFGADDALSISADWLPYLGVVTSAGSNAYLLGDVAKQGIFYGRTRHLAEKYDLPLPVNLAQGLSPSRALRGAPRHTPSVYWLETQRCTGNVYCSDSECRVAVSASSSNDRKRYPRTFAQTPPRKGQASVSLPCASSSRAGCTARSGCERRTHRW